jgi:hypothetical protein
MNHELIIWALTILLCLSLGCIVYLLRANQTAIECIELLSGKRVGRRIAKTIHSGHTVVDANELLAIPEVRQKIRAMRNIVCHLVLV